MTVTADGTHTLRFWSADRAGNVESQKSTTFTITGAVAMCGIPLLLDSLLAFPPILLLCLGIVLRTALEEKFQSKIKRYFFEQRKLQLQLLADKLGGRMDNIATSYFAFVVNLIGEV